MSLSAEHATFSLTLLTSVHVEEVPEHRKLLAASRLLDVGLHWKLQEEAGCTCFQYVSVTARFHSKMDQPRVLNVCHTQHSLTLHTGLAAVQTLPSGDTAQTFWLENQLMDENAVHLRDPSFLLTEQPADCIHMSTHCHNACDEDHHLFFHL